VLESNKDPYKNAVRLYKKYRRSNKFSNRVLDTPKLDGKPQDCTQPRSANTSVDNAALSTLQPRLARLEHHLCREQSSAIARTSRESPVASLIDLCPPNQPQVPLSFDERRIFTGETSMQGTLGLAHVSPVQADATVATAHSRGQPKPQGSIAPHSASGDIQGLAQPSAAAASVKHSGVLRNSNLSEGYSTDVTTYALLPSFLKSAGKPRISTHSERRHVLPSLSYRRSSGSSSVSSISSMGSEDDQKAGQEHRDKDKQQCSTTIRAGCHSSDKTAKQCARSRGDRCKSQRSLSRHQISNNPSSDPSSSDSGSSSSSSSDGDCKWAKNKTQRYQRKPHKTRSAPVKTKVYKRK